ncbi:hypothetical protein [Haloplanus pelagicus]|uniref:hypothetical protein n=1 Tax=Haloplanus pelagicus TaxID=2949995 RepID=UPI00203E3FCA|nr:hypothetical protein [Haloplanus sp. HW8-1]
MADGEDRNRRREGDDSAVTWTALPDRDADRLRLAVLHLGAGVAGLFGLALLSALLFVLVDGLAGENVDVAVLVGVLAFVGGPASLWYLLLSVEHGTDRERETLVPSAGWLRLRYLPPAMLGAVVLFLPLAVEPGLLLAYPVAAVVCRAAVDSRYTVGHLDPETGTLRQVTGAAAAEYAADATPGPDDRAVRTWDLSSLRAVHRRRIGGYTVFLPRYRRRGRWGRAYLLVVPNDAADRVATALDTVVRTSDWEPGPGLDRAVRVALGGLGLCFLGAAGAFVVVAGERASIVAYALGTLGLFGAALLLAAIRG